jgi:hypothetical protein
MAEGIQTLPEGNYRTQAIGPESVVQSTETKLSVDAEGVISVQSPLYEKPYSIGNGETFKDPRVDKFLQVVAHHQFQHFTTRQLSLVEEFETRPGASRFVRLGGLLDVAKMLNDLSGTFEQIVQAVISDFAHPAGSHLRGDFMVGDYKKQDTHDKDLWKYICDCGLKDALSDAKLIDDEGRLSGSPMLLEDLADPRRPRLYDIVECPRPDGNADRNQFTLHEGLITHPASDIREARASIVRVETADGERMAMNSPDAARLLYILGVRHQTESWAEPLHRLVEELVLLPDRYAFCANPNLAWAMTDWYPVDYARTDERSWYERIQDIGAIDPLVECALGIARAIAVQQRVDALTYTTDNAYNGPTKIPGMEIVEGSNRLKTTMSVSDNQLWIALPSPKYRGPIDSLVVTDSGLTKISKIDTSLPVYAQSRMKWMAPLLAKITLPGATAREIARGIEHVERHWSNATANQSFPNPGHREHMPADVLKHQVDAARAAAIRDSRV